MVSYDYNSNEPRFYSKLFASQDPFLYDVTVANASLASTAEPKFFEPKFKTDGYGYQHYEVDGGVIANNPSFYAY